MELTNKQKGQVSFALQIFIGCVFVFSGYVKVVDPMGGLYKITDYLTAFHWDSLKVLGFWGMTLMAAAEFTLGVGMLVGLRQKLTAMLVLAFMCFMTPLTLYLALYDPVSDCGCFGDALVITNWQTFWKNVVLLAATLVVLRWHVYRERGLCTKCEIALAAYSMIFMLCVSAYCFSNLPIHDFRPYKIGVNIPKQMEVPEGAPSDVYKTTMIYEKDGQQKEFTLQDYPKDDTTWKFVDTRNELVSKGYEPPIHDFVLESQDDGDITDLIVSDTNYVFLLVAHNLTEYNLFTNPGGCSANYADKVNRAYEYAQSHGYRFYCLSATSAGSDEMDKYLKATGAQYGFLSADEIMLKTIIRSSPGLVLIKNGDVLNKWATKDIPAFDAPLASCQLGQMQKPNNFGRLLLVAFLFLLPLALAFVAVKKGYLRCPGCEKCGR